MVGSWLMIGGSNGSSDQLDPADGQIVGDSPPGSPDHERELPPATTIEESDSATDSNSELTAPLTALIEKQRRLSESASLTMPQSSPPDSGEPPPKPLPWLSICAAFAMGFLTAIAVGYSTSAVGLLRGWLGRAFV